MSKAKILRLWAYSTFALTRQTPTANNQNMMTMTRQHWKNSQAYDVPGETMCAVIVPRKQNLTRPSNEGSLVNPAFSHS